MDFKKQYIIIITYLLSAWLLLFEYIYVSNDHGP